jgi:hypothetical protein
MRQSVGDCALGFRVAWRVLKPGEPIEQFVDQLAFLWGHGVLP